MRATAAMEQGKRHDPAASIVPPPLRTIDAETLLATPFPPLRYAVEGLLPQGLNLLAGSPKIGKSWLVLWLCLMAAKGEAVWTFPTVPGSVLYLSLEDSYQRIQDRLFQLTDEAPETLHFANASCSLDDGLLEQAATFVAEHADTRLIAIDTLQRIRNNASETNAYASDYRDLARLKAFADRHNLALLLIHHLRKAKDDDPLNQVSGSSGIVGAADGNFVLVKESRDSNKAKLIVSGRDIEYQELVLEFEMPFWKMIAHNKGEDLRRAKEPPFLQAVITHLAEYGGFVGSATELLQRMGETDTPTNTVTKLLNQHHDALAEGNIRYSYRRTNGQRIIELAPDRDGCDSCDTSSPRENQPSLPS